MPAGVHELVGCSRSSMSKRNYSYFYDVYWCFNAMYYCRSSRVAASRFSDCTRARASQSQARPDQTLCAYTLAVNKVRCNDKWVRLSAMCDVRCAMHCEPNVHDAYFYWHSLHYWPWDSLTSQSLYYTYTMYMFTCNANGKQFWYWI